MGLYLDSGYLDYDYILSKGCAWNIIIGGRAIGKTYGALLKMAEMGATAMLMRRMQTQVDIIASDLYSPYNVINDDMGWKDIWLEYVKEQKNLYGLYWMTEQDGKKIKYSDICGYSAALSTFKNLRGFDGTKIEYLIFDEFIPEPGEKKIKFEGSAVLSAYETINRNRELEGRPPLRTLLLANAHDISSPVLLELDVVADMAKMLKSGQEERIDTRRGIAIWLIKSSPISERKRDTALYRLGNDKYSRMSLGNEFPDGSSEGVISRALKEYKPLGAINSLVIYEHKSKPMYYVSLHRSGSPRQYTMTPDGLACFRADFSWLRIVRMQGRVEYENELCRALLTNLGF